MPMSNLAEVLEFPQLLLNGLVVYFVKDYKEVYELLFIENSEKRKGILTMRNGIMSENSQKCEVKLNWEQNIKKII